MTATLSLTILDSRATRLRSKSLPQNFRISRFIRDVGSYAPISVCKHSPPSQSENAKRMSFDKEGKKKKQTKGKKAKRSLFHTSTWLRSYKYSRKVQSCHPQELENASHNSIQQEEHPEKGVTESAEGGKTGNSLGLSILSALKNGFQDGSPAVFQIPMQLKNILLVRSVLRYLLWYLKNNGIQKNQLSYIHDTAAKQVMMDEVDCLNSAANLAAIHRLSLFKLIRHHTRLFVKMISKFRKLSRKSRLNLNLYDDQSSGPHNCCEKTKTKNLINLQKYSSSILEMQNPDHNISTLSEMLNNDTDAEVCSEYTRSAAVPSVLGIAQEDTSFFPLGYKSSEGAVNMNTEIVGHDSIMSKLLPEYSGNSDFPSSNKSKLEINLPESRMIRPIPSQKLQSPILLRTSISLDMNEMFASNFNYNRCSKVSHNLDPILENLQMDENVAAEESKLFSKTAFPENNCIELEYISREEEQSKESCYSEPDDESSIELYLNFAFPSSTRDNIHELASSGGEGSYTNYDYRVFENEILENENESSQPDARSSCENQSDFEKEKNSQENMSHEYHQQHVDKSLNNFKAEEKNKFNFEMECYTNSVIKPYASAGIVRIEETFENIECFNQPSFEVIEEIDEETESWPNALLDYKDFSAENAVAKTFTFPRTASRLNSLKIPGATLETISEVAEATPNHSNSDKDDFNIDADVSLLELSGPEMYLVIHMEDQTKKESNINHAVKNCKKLQLKEYLENNWMNSTDLNSEESGLGAFFESHKEDAKSNSRTNSLGGSDERMKKEVIDVSENPTETKLTGKLTYTPAKSILVPLPEYRPNLDLEDLLICEYSPHIKSPIKVEEKKKVNQSVSDDDETIELIYSRYQRAEVAEENPTDENFNKSERFHLKDASSCISVMDSRNKINCELEIGISEMDSVPRKILGGDHDLIERCNFESAECRGGTICLKMSEILTHFEALVAAFKQKESKVLSAQTKADARKLLSETKTMPRDKGLRSSQNPDTSNYQFETTRKCENERLGSLESPDIQVSDENVIDQNTFVLFETITNFPIYWKDLSAKCNSEVFETQSQENVKILIDRYRSVFLHLIEHVISPCDQKIRALMSSLLEIRRIETDLISLGADAIRETAKIVQSAQSTTSLKNTSWKDLLQSFNFALAEMSEKFQNVKERLLSLESEASSDIKYIVDSIECIGATHHEIIKQYYSFCEKNTPLLTSGLLDIDEYTFVEAYRRKTAWYCEVNLEAFEREMRADVDSLACSSRSAGAMFCKLQETFSKLELIWFGCPLRLFLEFDCETIADMLEDNDSRQNKDEEACIKLNNSLKNFKRKKRKNKSKKHKKSKTRNRANG